MATKINVRSPYFLRFTYSGLSYVNLTLTIWDGTEGTPSGETEYTFTKSVIGSNDYVIFEVADYIRDVIATEYGNGAQTTNAVWVDWSASLYDGSPTPVLLATQTTSSQIEDTVLAVDGYGYFEDGLHPNHSNDLLQDNTDIYYLDGRDIVFAVWDEGVTNVSIDGASVPAVYWEQVSDYWDEYVATWESGATDQAIGDSTDSSNKIVYVKITDTDQFADTETITITKADLSTITLTLHKVCEPKYTPYKAIFYNRHGAMQDLWFFKRSDKTLSVSGDTFKRNIIDFSSTPTYNTSKHQIKSFNLNGIEQIKLNTGFLPENFNEIIQQLILAEEVWLDNGTQVLPVRPVTDSLRFKQSVNDKLISYEMDFEYAYDKINNIR